MGHAVGAVRYLTDCGERLKDSRICIAQVLNSVGVRTARASGTITARTLKEWGDKASAEPRSTTAIALKRFPSGGKWTDVSAEKQSLLRAIGRIAQRFKNESVNPLA